MASSLASPRPLLLPQKPLHKPFDLGLGLGFHSPRSVPLGRRSSQLRWKLLPIGSVVEASLRRGAGGGSSSSSSWDDEPYELLPGGRRAYLDEQDVASFLDPPKELIPIDPDSYNPASYLWKKIGDIPEERRDHLLSTLKSRHISRMWELAGTRYQDVKLAKQSSSPLLSMSGSSPALEVWTCRTSKGALPVPWFNDFKKVIFRGKDGDTYGRIILGALNPFSVARSYHPLYFKVKQVVEVMSTEQPCDLAYEFGDGLFDHDVFPENFLRPVRHPWPFNDQLVIYIRHAGPGSLVGQAWQEGKSLEQVPKKLCGEILMVKDYSTTG
ncbi:uncharacterized protein LOC109711564 [Ananas comosus]|uniref:Uncharacterized protein LOC109711564 n=1 Tax=Ananas comosus TaxID=4615 RepID=A0A199UX61_ANACO|nr:uncharacterized protein LOC109711564 [Ananas comosus]OAY69388.1 hypothetical protein ACMD2_00949 [Ananas comosus]